MATLLQKTTRITSILKESYEQSHDDMPFASIAQRLSEIIDCNSCIINSQGDLLGYFMRYKTNTDRVEAFFESRKLPEVYAKEASFVYQTEANLNVNSTLSIYPVETKENFPDGVTTVAPIHITGIRLGSLIIWRNDQPFDEDDLILVEIASTVVGLQMLNHQREIDEENLRRRSTVSMAVNTLSYSELRAVSAILDELGGTEGQLTASVVADRIGITRSVIVNALRKLESAGIIESRSLGMKGTYLKVLIPDVFEEIKKREF
ncbi:GTP-sensing pleiotropic transcriptional regulator CodY [Streptococcus danieliae]|uniref:Global transcriptional regulator CodY n=1 Tax=Streptococcus danieliae TaxID=747656 RepID=A0A7Z0S5V5_9STRE|nr:GTP-sensing pleiotropic transcriptional regulator CodY [Streptococcus danieliae]MBF0698948.1 GTP-sensing pleiotropic transcriptional regulator CodY [Streptococcus danieliae]NYS96125.1 GTP-sensing pleiotropic transcriptional regulator CodY [Streptococcus danieliae]